MACLMIAARAEMTCGADSVFVNAESGLDDASPVREWAIDVGRSYHKPYDPSWVAVDAALPGATGRALVVPAFWRPQCGSRGGAF
ncbi:MAG: hypothetical protein ACTHM6_11730 [Tepidisphaeraceae bacterium]